MKSIILAGASRSGKTTLARRLQKETGFSLLSGDALINAFGKHFPDLHIAQKEKLDVTARNLLPFLGEYLKVMDDLLMPFILDIYHFLPEQAVQEKFSEKYHVAFIGYPEIDPAQKLHNMRNFTTEHLDWTHKCTDEELLGMAQRLQQHSQRLRKSCGELGLDFIDTSHDFENTLDRAFTRIIAAINEPSPDIARPESAILTKLPSPL